MSDSLYPEMALLTGQWNWPQRPGDPCAEVTQLRRLAAEPRDATCKRGKFKAKERRLMSDSRKCGCGRSPTGNCIGWHKLTKEEYEAKLAAYQEKQAAKATAAE